MTVRREESVNREKTNKMQQPDIYYQLPSQHASGIIMPIFRRTKTVWYCIRCTAPVLLDVVGSGCGALSYNAAPHNRYQPHLAEPAQYTVCSNARSLFSWRWAWWCPKHVETEVDNKHPIVASCWFFLSSHLAHDARSQEPKTHTVHYGSYR